MHAFAYFCLNEDGGLFVCPTSTGYVLKSFNTDDEDDDQYLHVEPDTWYDVEITFDWTSIRARVCIWTWLSWAKMAAKFKELSRRVSSCEPQLQPWHCALYNYGTPASPAIRGDGSEMT